MKNSAYWDIQEGQIAKTDVLDSGYRDKTKANFVCRTLINLSHIDTYVALLNTVEHDLPTDDPSYKTNQAYFSQRWCVIIPNQNETWNKFVGMMALTAYTRRKYTRKLDKIRLH